MRNKNQINKTYTIIDFSKWCPNNKERRNEFKKPEVAKYGILMALSELIDIMAFSSTYAKTFAITGSLSLTLLAMLSLMLILILANSVIIYLARKIIRPISYT